MYKYVRNGFVFWKLSSIRSVVCLQLVCRSSTAIEAHDKIHVVEADRDRFWKHFGTHISSHPAIAHHEQNPQSRWHHPVGFSGDDAKYTLAGRKIIVMMLSSILQTKQRSLLANYNWFFVSDKIFSIYCVVDCCGFNLEQMLNTSHLRGCSAQVWISAVSHSSFCATKWVWVDDRLTLCFEYVLGRLMFPGSVFRLAAKMLTSVHQIDTCSGVHEKHSVT